MTDIVLHDYQLKLKNDIYTSWQQGNRNVCAVLPTGGGKCLAKNTPVLMYDGTIKMSQDIQYADVLMGPDSQPRVVKNICSGIDNLYRISSDKGHDYVVNSKHILSLRRTNEKSLPLYPCQKRGGEIVNISIEEYLKKSKWFKHIHKGYRVPVDFPMKEKLPVDPYWFGLWLGDGTSRNTCITTADSEINNYLHDFANKNGLSIRTERKPDNAAVGIFIRGKKPPKGRIGLNFLHKFLIDYNLIQNKHIPLNYKTASREDRLKLLAGIIDSDGYLNKKTGYDLTLKCPELLDDVIFVARSLGFSAYKNLCIKTCCNNGKKGIYFSCSIQGNVNEIPCIIERKKAEKRKQKKNVLNVGIKVTPDGIGEYFGFEVMGNDNLFVLGDFTVTHNSIVLSDIALDGANLGLKQSIIAHRNELVSQMSMHIANRGIYHRIVGPDKTISQITKMHRAEYGRSFINPSAPTSVAGVDTIMHRADELKDWAIQQDLWTIDEFHHTLRENKWGKAVNMFRNARGLGATATPSRADGMGLGANYDGVAHSMVLGPTMRELIDMGHLSDYEIVCPESDLHVENEEVGKDGDWSPQKLKKAAKNSHIVGDVVREYFRHALGKQAICFATDIETSGDIAKKFNDAGIRAASLSSKTPDNVRAKYIAEFRSGKLTVLVNVDLFDEGFDVPKCEVVIMARPTASLGKYLQMVGRGLRTFLGKLYGLIIDHVSNVIRHGLPDKYRLWSLARRDKRGKQEKDPEDIELTVCKSCTKPYERVLSCCPYCGAYPPLPEPRERSITHVDGNLILLDRAKLAEMRAATMLPSAGDVAERVAAVAGEIAGRGQANRQIEKIAAQKRLSDAIAQWAAIQRMKGRTDESTYKRFFLTVGVDVLSALSVERTRQEYEQLAERVEGWCNAL